MSRKTIAVLGASTDRAKYGNKCVRAYLHAGWEVYPVNAWSDTIEGLRVYKKLAEVPVELERVSVYLPPPVTLEMIPEMAAKGPVEVWFNPGSADLQVVEAARAAGLATISACSIVAIGLRPTQFPD